MKDIKMVYIHLNLDCPYNLVLFLPAARLVNMCCRSNKEGEEKWSHLAFYWKNFYFEKIIRK